MGVGMADRLSGTRSQRSSTSKTRVSAQPPRRCCGPVLQMTYALLGRGRSHSSEMKQRPTLLLTCALLQK